MLCVWWNFEDVIHWEFVSNGRAIDTDLYFEKLDRVHEILKRRYPALVNRNRILVQQDNARPHTARTTMPKIQEYRGIKLQPHPAYSPDLAPSDYHLVRSMGNSCVEEISKILNLWKWVTPNSSHQKPD